MFRTFKNCCKSSNYLELLYQQSKVAQTPFFTINSSAIRIIEDPLDFYALLCVMSILFRVQFLILRKG